ncbi:MAG: formimidoylglutamate deiminase [Herbiconiux sp.]|nr:formimidoylglutamate deiminase [Herbiconiux sp.]
MSLWCASVVDGAATEHGVRFEVGDDGRILNRRTGPPQNGDLRLCTVVAGAGNAHSHAFHRALRGRTHDHGGDFWRWREEMYETAAALTPESYFALATAVFAEMLASGYTAVGEFHYLHHRVDGSAYPHAFERALAAAARATGIRLTLLDTAYLAGGIGRPLEGTQRRFGDGDAAGYLRRWHALRAELPSLGAALHSVRAVDPAAIAEIVAGLPAEVPLHIHLSEQPRENSDSVAAYGLTPTALLARAGVLSPRLTVVHATHLSDDDIRMLGDARVSVAMCPTTEADLGDGIGPARRLADAGAVIALGSDQNAVIDPFLEMRGLEMHERLAARARGRFRPAELFAASADGSYRALGLGSHRLQPGDLCDLVEIDPGTERTAGADPRQFPLVATAADVRRVLVGGRVVADSGVLADGRRPARLLTEALAAREAVAS